MATGDDYMSGFGRSSKKAQTYVDKAKGGASILDEVNFGGASAFRRKEEERAEINQQRHENKRRQRENRIMYRKAVRSGDIRGAAAVHEKSLGFGAARRHGDDFVAAGQQVEQQELGIENANLLRGEPNVDQVGLQEDFADLGVDITTAKGKSRAHQLFKDNPMATTAHERRKLLKELAKDPDFKVPKAKRARDPFTGEKSNIWDFGQGPAPARDGEIVKGKAKAKGKEKEEEEEEDEVGDEEKTEMTSHTGEGAPTKKSSGVSGAEGAEGAGGTRGTREGLNIVGGVVGGDLSEEEWSNLTDEQRQTAISDAVAPTPEGEEGDPGVKGKPEPGTKVDKADKKKQKKEARQAAKRAAEIRGKDWGLGTTGSGEFRQPYRMPKFRKGKEPDHATQLEDLLVERRAGGPVLRETIAEEQKERIAALNNQAFRPFTAEAWQTPRQDVRRRHGNLREQNQWSDDLRKGSPKGLSQESMPAFLAASEEVKRATRMGMIGTRYAAQYLADLRRVYGDYDAYSRIDLEVPPPEPPSGREIRENPNVLNEWIGAITAMTAEDDGRVTRREIDKADRAKADEMAAERARIDQAKSDRDAMRDPRVRAEVENYLKRVGLD